jgi:hypothetical protein
MASEKVRPGMGTLRLGAMVVAEVPEGEDVLDARNALCFC